MIKGFSLSGYKSFKRASLNKLTNVNLIVGKNNSGKTALLEALNLYFSNFSREQLLERILQRNECFSPNGSSMGEVLKSIFHGRKIPEHFKDAITLSSDVKSYNLKLVPYAVRYSDDGFTKSEQLSMEDYKALGNELDISSYLRVYSEGKESSVCSLDRDFDSVRSSARRADRNQVSKSIFLPTYGLEANFSSNLWDIISLSTDSKEVLDALRLIEPKILSFSFFSIESNRRTDFNRIPFVLIEGELDPVPLKSLGEGATRVLDMILGVLGSKGSAFIVDEFENGLHWSVQKPVWEILFKLSKAHNVQIFCTTHSKDCVESFCDVWEEHKKTGSFIRIIHDGSSKIKEYDFDLLSDSVELDVEVR